LDHTKLFTGNQANAEVVGAECQENLKAMDLEYHKTGLESLF
jgi:hypothetical protein